MSAPAIGAVVRAACAALLVLLAVTCPAFVAGAEATQQTHVVERASVGAGVPTATTAAANLRAATLVERTAIAGGSSWSTSSLSLRRAAKARRGAIELPAFTASTVDEALTSAGRLTKGGEISEGARAIAKKQGDGAVPFAGLPRTAEQADAIIRDVLANPVHVFRGDRVIDAYNAAGQGVRLRPWDRSFVGFLDAAKRTQ
jgi:hypothetical protein